MEGRSRRNNIKLVGIPEGEEKGNPTEFVSTLIPKLLGETNYPKLVIIERGHRAPLPKPTEVDHGNTVRPRTIIAHVHHFQDKEIFYALSGNSISSSAQIGFSFSRTKQQKGWISSVVSATLWQPCERRRISTVCGFLPNFTFITLDSRRYLPLPAMQ